MTFWALIILLNPPVIVSTLSESRCRELAIIAQATYPGAQTICYRSWP
jgi:hypothetical protein